MRNRATIEIKQKAIDLYNSGLSANSISKLIEYNEATIRNWLKLAGISIRCGGGYNKKYSADIISKVKRLYEKGIYTTEIDRMLGFRKGNAQYILNNDGVELRHRGPKSKIGREDYFDDINSQDKAYFLGLIVADGNVSIVNNQYCLKFHISIKDKEIIDKFLDTINCSNKASIKNNGSSYYVSLTSVHMCKRLIELGVIPNKTGREYIPLDIPKGLISHFIRGVFDGDGITDISKKRSGFVGSVNIINSIMKCLDENLTIFQAGKSNKVVYFLGGKKFSKKLYNYLYQDAEIWLERKRARLEYIYT